jgi:hypothetical protein
MATFIVNFAGQKAIVERVQALKRDDTRFSYLRGRRNRLQLELMALRPTNDRIS